MKSHFFVVNLNSSQKMCPFELHNMSVAKKLKFWIFAEKH